MDELRIFIYVVLNIIYFTLLTSEKIKHLKEKSNNE